MATILNPFIFNLTSTSGTPGSVVFIGATNQLTEDNANFFYDDTNNRLGIGVNSGLTAKLQLNTTSASEIGQIIKGTTSQSGNLLELRDTSDNILTSFNELANLRFKNSNKTFTALGTFHSISAGVNASLSNFTFTITPPGTSGSMRFDAFIDAGTYNLTAAPGSTSISFNTFIAGRTIKNDSALSGASLLSGPVVLSNSIIVQADTNTFTVPSAYGFNDIFTFTTVNGGTLNITDNKTISSVPVISNTAGTVNLTTRIGFEAQDIFMSGAGTKNVTTNIGFRANDFANTATTRIGFYQLGTNAHNRLVGDTSLGQDTTPAAKLDILNTTAGNPVVLLKGASSQSGDYITIKDNSNVELIKVGQAGLPNLEFLPDDYSGASVTLISSGRLTSTTTLGSSQNYILLSDSSNHTISASGNSSSIIVAEVSLLNRITNDGTGSPTFTRYRGVQVGPSIRSAGNTLTVTESTGYLSAQAFGFGATAGSTTVITTARGLWVLDNVTASGATTTVTTRVGVDIDDFTPTGSPTVTTNVGLRIIDQTSGTTKIGIQQLGTNAHNRLVGKTNIGQDATPTEDLHVHGSFSAITRTVTSGFTIDTTTRDYIVFCNFSSGQTVTLPAPTNGRVLILKDISGTAGTNNITIARNGSESIDGIAASKVFKTDWGSLTITSDGTNWFTV